MVQRLLCVAVVIICKTLMSILWNLPFPLAMDLKTNNKKKYRKYYYVIQEICFIIKSVLYCCITDKILRLKGKKWKPQKPPCNFPHKFCWRLERLRLSPVDVHGQWVFYVPHHLQVATHVLVRHDACHTHFNTLTIVCSECSESVVSSSKCILAHIQKISQLAILSLLPWMHLFFLCLLHKGAITTC